MASGNVPDFDGAVVAAASDKFVVRRKSNGVDTVIETSEHMKHTGTSKDNNKKNLLFRVPGQRRLAISRFRVPNLDGVVPTAAGNFLSIGAPRHRIDTVFVRSKYTNQQK